MATGPLAPRDAQPVPERGRADLHNRVGRLERLIDAVGLRRRRLDRAAFGPRTEEAVIATTCLMAPLRPRLRLWWTLSGLGLFRWADCP